VGTILLLLFAICWRSLRRESVFGAAAGLGTIIKLQPALLLVWAVMTGRRRAAVIGIAVAAVLALVGAIAAGPQAWTDMLSVLGHVSRPVLAENDTGIGRLVFLAGGSVDLATLVHYANVVLVLTVSAYAVLRLPSEPSLLVVMAASQFVSPVLWDHYALILLLPVAWLLERGRWWAALIPLVTTTLLLGATPPAAYPVCFWVTILAIVLESRRAGARLGASTRVGAGARA
jgi:alpha-1,2-mannosyltransferase